MDDWMTELRRGNSDPAWDLFLNRYRRLIFAAIRHYAQDYDDVMDVFARVCESLREDDRRRLRAYTDQRDHRAAFSTWLVSIVRNRTVDWFRHRDGWHRISVVAERLPPLQRRIFEHVFVERRSHVEAYELIRAGASPTLSFRQFVSELRQTYTVVTSNRRGRLLAELGAPAPPENEPDEPTTEGIGREQKHEHRPFDEWRGHELPSVVAASNAEQILMKWLDRARSRVRDFHRISLPDPDRIDIGAVPDTVTLLDAIDAAMPRTAVLELIGLRHSALAAFLAACPDATQHRDDGYVLSVDHGMIAALGRVARDCGTDPVCAHLLVHDGDHTLLEAFGRDKGEDVVWLSRRLPKAILHQFLEALSPSPTSAPRASRPPALSRESWRVHALASR